MSLFFFFKQKTAYEVRISDWSSDVCSSDLLPTPRPTLFINTRIQPVAPYHADARRNHAAITPREARRTDRLALLRQRQDRGDARRLARGQLCRAMLEISLRARLDALGADTRLGELVRAHVCTPAHNAHLVCRLLLEKKKK